MAGGGQDWARFEGRKIGNYQLANLLGSGGMGAVFLATHAVLQRQVAVKILAPGLALSPGYIDRFFREAARAGAIDHPHVVRVYDAGQVENDAYLAMEYVEGTSLRAVARSGPADESRVKPVVRQILQALAGLEAAHALGIVHRDIKPDNLLTDHGRTSVKIADFGLARSDADDAITSTGIILGTPPYMPMEQWQGLTLDARADIYAMGVTLYQMLSGRLPIGGRTPAAVFAKLHSDDRRPLLQAAPYVPRALARLVERMIARNADDRPASSAETRAALLGWLDEPDPAHAPARSTSSSGAAFDVRHAALERAAADAVQRSGELGQTSPASPTPPRQRPSGRTVAHATTPATAAQQGLPFAGGFEPLESDGALRTVSDLVGPTEAMPPASPTSFDRAAPFTTEPREKAPVPITDTLGIEATARTVPSDRQPVIRAGTQGRGQNAPRASTSGTFQGRRSASSSASQEARPSSSHGRRRAVPSAASPRAARTPGAGGAYPPLPGLESDDEAETNGGSGARSHGGGGGAGKRRETWEDANPPKMRVGVPEFAERGANGRGYQAPPPSTRAIARRSAAPTAIRLLLLVAAALVVAVSLEAFEVVDLGLNVRARLGLDPSESNNDANATPADSAYAGGPTRAYVVPLPAPPREGSGRGAGTVGDSHLDSSGDGGPAGLSGSGRDPGSGAGDQSGDAGDHGPGPRLDGHPEGWPAVPDGYRVMLDEPFRVAPAAGDWTTSRTGGGSVATTPDTSGADGTDGGRTDGVLHIVTQAVRFLSTRVTSSASYRLDRLHGLELQVRFRVPDGQSGMVGLGAGLRPLGVYIKLDNGRIGLERRLVRGQPSTFTVLHGVRATGWHTARFRWADEEMLVHLDGREVARYAAADLPIASDLHVLLGRDGTGRRGELLVDHVRLAVAH